LALAALSPEKALMGQLGLRYGNIQEAEGGREGRISIFVFLIESRSFVSIYLPEWRGWKSRLLLAPAFIYKALGIVKCDSRSK